MKICLYICLLIMLSLSTQQNEFTSIIDIIKAEIKPIIRKSLDEYENEDNCKQILEEAFFSDDINKTGFFFEKLIQDSSKSKNDLSTYYNCKKRKYNYNNFNLSDITYIELIIDETDIIDSLESETLFYILGICVPKGCTNKEYKHFLNKTFMDVFHNNTDQLIDQSNTTNSTNKTKLKYSYIFLDEINDTSSKAIKHFFLNLIPFFLLCIQVLLVLLKCVPFSIFKICFKKKKQNLLVNDNRDNPDEIVSYYKTEYRQFVTTMSIYKHWENLFSVKDSGITYIKGLRGLNIIFLFFGYLLFCLYNNPISIYEEHAFFIILKNLFYFVFYIGLRYSPAILVSCSAYSLFFKFSCFLDENVRDVGIRRHENRKTQSKQSDDLIPIQNALDNPSQKMESEDGDDDEGGGDQDVQVKFLLRFFLNHLYKYFMYVFVLMFIRFSLHSLVLWINNFEIGPIWGYCWERIIKLSVKDLIKGILLLQSLFRYNENGNEEIFTNYMNIVTEECISFILFVVGIFLVHRFKFRLDFGVVSLFLFIIFIKLLIFMIGHFLSETEGVMKETEYVTFYYHLEGTLKVRFPVYNLTYPLIGFLFGGVNYIFQKKLVKWEKIVESKKEWLSIPFTIFTFYKKKSKDIILVIGIVFLLIIFVFSEFQSVLLHVYPKDKNDEHLQKLYTNFLLNFFMHIDIEIVVILIHLASFGFFYTGDNIFHNFLTSSMWNIFEKLYFCIILVINPVMIYVLAQCESRINLTMYNLIIYTLICGFLIIIVAGFVYIFIESPIQKVSKLITNTFLRERQKEEQRDPTMDALLKID